MPRISLIPEVYHQPTDPYHHEYDNIPLKNIVERQEIINFAVDGNTEELQSAAGSAGSLSNRLNQSLDDSGSITVNSIDETLHSIGSHTDGAYDGIDYVRMKESERDKLSLIADAATSLKIQLETISVTNLFSNETIRLLDSDTVKWTLEDTNIVKANFAFPTSAAHQHHNDVAPVRQNASGSDYQNWKTTSVSTAFIKDSLAVYLNGIRIPRTLSIAQDDAVNEVTQVYAIPHDGPDGSWILTSFTADPAAGTFAFDRNLNENDIIRIDFEESYT